MFVTLNMVERGPFNEDTGSHEEISKPVVVNANNIRAFYSRRDARPGTRITFSDGGGFAVAEAPDVVAALVAGGDVHRLALVAPANEIAS